MVYRWSLAIGDPNGNRPHRRRVCGVAVVTWKAYGLREIPELRVAALVMIDPRGIKDSESSL